MSSLSLSLHYVKSKKLRASLLTILSLKVLGFAAFSEVPAIAQTIKVGLGLFSTYLIVRIHLNLTRKGVPMRFKLNNMWGALLYAAFLLMGFVSLLWSSDIVFSIIQLLRYFDFFVFSIVFMRCVFALEMLDTGRNFRLSFFVSRASFLNVSVFIVGYFVDPDTFMRDTHGGDVSRLGGLIMNPNEVGMLCVVAISASYSELSAGGGKFPNVLVIGLSLFALYLTSSRSSMIGFALVTVFFVLRSKNLKLIVPMICVGVIVGPIVFNVVFLKEGHVDAEEIMSMTGRIPFWKALTTEALPKEPYGGYGFMCIYYTKFFQGANTYPASMTHNTFIQVLMSLGLVGSTIVFFQMVATICAVVGSKDFEKIGLFVAVFVPIFINSLTEFGIWGITNYGVLFYQLLVMSFVFSPLEDKQAIVAQSVAKKKLVVL